MWVWNPISLVGIVAGLLAWTLAVLVFRAGPARFQNRVLAGFFAFAGASSLWTQGVRLLLAGDDVVPFVTNMGMTVTFVGTPLMWWLYLAFLSTIASPVGRFLARSWVQLVAGLFFAGVAVHVLIAPEQYVRGLIPWRHIDAWQYDVGSASRNLLFWIAPAVGLLGITVALTGLHAAKTDALRRQFRWYAAAFVTYDILNIGYYLLLNLEINDQQSGPFVEQLYFMLGGSSLILLTLLLAYGFLHAHILDIDLRIKIGLRSSFIVAPFALAFFVLAETLEDKLPFPGYWAGLLGAGIVALALQPIRRLAERVSSRLLPGVEDTPAYRQHRADAVYVAALESAARDGMITHRERDILVGLRTSLGISADRAALFERQVLGQTPQAV